MNLFEPLKVSSKEFEDIIKLIDKTCPNQCVISIEKLINKDLLDRYETYKNSLKSKNYTEIYGFHGTSTDNICNIGKIGFKKEFNKVSAYGLGTYLASSFGYSKNYSKIFNIEYKALFVCKFIYTNITIGKSKQKCPNGFDVQVDKLDKPSIYSIDIDEAVLPLYLVRFY